MTKKPKPFFKTDRTDGNFFVSGTRKKTGAQSGSFFIKASPKPEKKNPAPKSAKVKQTAKPKKVRVGLLARVKRALARKPKKAAVAPTPSTSPEKDYEQQKFNRLVQIYEELHQIDRKEFMR